MSEDTTAGTTVVDNADEHRFEVYADGERAGYAVYEDRGDVVAFVHTVIDDRFGGRGLGTVLARAALDAERDAGRAVVPVCPFIRHFITTHPEYVDLVPRTRRIEFGLPGGTTR